MRNKLLISFLIIGVLPATILGLFIFTAIVYNVENTVKESYENKLSSVCQLMEDTLDTLIQSSELNEAERLENLSSLPFVKKVSKISKAAGKDEIWIKKSIDHTTVNIQLDNHYIETLLKGQGMDMVSIEYGSMNKKSLSPFHQDNNYIICMNELFDGIIVKEYVDRKSAFGNITVWNEVIIRMIFIIIIVSICGAIGLAYTFTNGVEELLLEMKKVRKGDFSESNAHVGDDEIGLLTKSFKKMTAELNVLINKTYKLKLSEREAHIKVLQSQISPHFIYNALDSINWSLIQKGDFETSNILIALSEMLRYSIDDSKTMVSLREEMHQVENYLKVQKNRFGSRFEYSIALDEETEDIIVPKMIVQPIVENAISHGLEERINGELQISSQVIENGMELCVYDTGKGMSQERLDFVKNEMNAVGQIAKEKDFHLGIANVNNRINYIFGKNSRLLIDSMENQYTKVILHIEIEDKDNDDFSC